MPIGILCNEGLRENQNYVFTTVGITFWRCVVVGGGESSWNNSWGGGPWNGVWRSCITIEGSWNKVNFRVLYITFDGFGMVFESSWNNIYNMPQRNFIRVCVRISETCHELPGIMVEHPLNHVRDFFERSSGL